VAHRQHDIIWLSTGINREQYIISMEWFHDLCYYAWPLIST
jgi:hypothetical protein